MTTALRGCPVPVVELSTKATGDVAEYYVAAQLLERGFNVLKPCGDRLPYDVALDLDGRLVRIQVKMGWWDDEHEVFTVDVRRSLTNRRIFKSMKYAPSDFDFLIALIPGTSIVYIMPSVVACSYGSGITMVENRQRQRKARSVSYRNAWHLLEDLRADVRCPTPVLDKGSEVEHDGH